MKKDKTFTVDRLFTVPGMRAESILVLLPVGMEQGAAGRLITRATVAADSATNNGEESDFLMTWSAMLEGLGILVLGEAGNLPQIDTIPWDQATYTRPYVVCEKWRQENLRFVIGFSEPGSSKGAFLMAAQSEGNDGWFDLDDETQTNLFDARTRTRALLLF